jgi:DNA-binding MarR family transcriptional regulator
MELRPMERPNKEARRNAFLYCMFRDEQYALYDEYAKGNGILMNAFMVMNVLFYAKDGLTQREICDAIHHSKQTVNLIVGKLERDGHVELVPSPEDGRSKIVRLTESGRAFAERPVRHITRAEDTAMSMLAPEEQKQLVELSRRFTENLTELVRGA